MLLETFALSSTAATAIGLRAQYEYQALLKGQSVRGETIRVADGYKTLVRIAQDKARIEMPTYVNTGGNSTGISIPIGGGTVVEEEPLLHKAVHTNETQSITGGVIADFRFPNKSDLRYLNTAEDVDNFCAQHAIPKYSFPITLPLKVYTITPVEKLYTSTRWRLAGSSQAQVARVSMRWRYGNSFVALGLVAVGSGLLVAVDSWNQRRIAANYLRAVSSILSKRE